MCQGFLEAGKQRLVRNTKHQATAEVFRNYRRENEQLRQLVTESALKKPGARKVEFSWREGGVNDALLVIGEVKRCVGQEFLFELPLSGTNGDGKPVFGWGKRAAVRR